MKNARPKSMPAVDGDLAERLNQPTNHDPAPGRVGLWRELRRPVVQAAGGRVARGHLGHAERDERHEERRRRASPRVIIGRAAGVHREPNSVRQPDRIEMIVNETAKLEKVFIPLRSSWAYPS